MELDGSLAGAQALRDIPVAEAPFRSTTAILPGTPARARKGVGRRDKSLRRTRTITAYSIIEEGGAGRNLLSRRKDLWDLTGKNLWISTVQKRSACSTVKPP